MEFYLQQSQMPSIPISEPYKRLWLEVFPNKLNHRGVKDRVFGRLSRAQIDSPPALSAAETYANVWCGRDHAGTVDVSGIVSVLFVLEQLPNGDGALRVGQLHELQAEQQHHESNGEAFSTAFNFTKWDYRGGQPPPQPQMGLLPQTLWQSSGLPMQAQEQSYDGPLQALNGTAYGAPPILNANATPFVPGSPSRSLQAYPGIGQQVPAAPASMINQYLGLMQASTRRGFEAPTAPAAMISQHSAQMSTCGGRQAPTAPVAMSREHLARLQSVLGRLPRGFVPPPLAAHNHPAHPGQTRRGACGGQAGARPPTPPDSQENGNPFTADGFRSHQRPAQISQEAADATAPNLRGENTQEAGFAMDAILSHLREDNPQQSLIAIEEPSPPPRVDNSWESGLAAKRPPSYSWEDYAQSAEPVGDASPPYRHREHFLQQAGIAEAGDEERLYPDPWAQPRVVHEPEPDSKTILISSWNPYSGLWETYETPLSSGFFTGRRYFSPRFEGRMYHIDTESENRSRAILAGMPEFKRQLVLKSCPEPRGPGGRLMSGGHFRAIGDQRKNNGGT